MTAAEDHSDDTALAGEYVLHLLDADQRSAFEKRLRDEPALRDLVRDWDEQFVTLADDIAPVTPPKRVKAQLEQTLFADSAPRKSIWGWLTGGLVAASIAVAVVVVVPMIDPQPTYTASVAAEDGTLVVAANFVAERNRLELVRETGTARPGRVLELWLIAEGADAPVSLGVLSDAAETRIDLPPELAQQMANAVLAISDEPVGGSPTGAPTGDVLAVGSVTNA